MVLGKFPEPGHLTNLNYSNARAYAVGAGGIVWKFFSHLSFLYSFSLSLGDSRI